MKPTGNQGDSDPFVYLLTQKMTNLQRFQSGLSDPGRRLGLRSLQNLIGQLSHHQNPILKWSTQNHASRIKKANAAIYGKGIVHY